MASKTYYLFGKHTVSDKVAARYPLGVYRVKQDGARYAYPAMLAADEEGVAEATRSLMNLNPGTKYVSERLHNAPKA
jgi:hypothetical protein